MKQSLSRREMLARSSAGVGAGMLLGWHPALRAVSPERYGIRGETAPPLIIDHWVNGQGEPSTYDPDSMIGRWTIIKCWQSWCPGCHKHGFPTIKAIYDAFEGDDRVRVVGVQTVFEGFGINTVEKLGEIQQRYRLPIPMAHDPGDPDGDHRPRTMRDYRTGGTPWIIVVAPNRRVVFNDYHMSAERFIEFLKPKLT